MLGRLPLVTTGLRQLTTGLKALTIGACWVESPELSNGVVSSVLVGSAREVGTKTGLVYYAEAVSDRVDQTVRSDRVTEPRSKVDRGDCFRVSFCSCCIPVVVVQSTEP